MYKYYTEANIKNEYIVM